MRPRGIAYLGFCNSEPHKEYLGNMMVRKIFKEFGCGLSVLHQELFEADLKPLLGANDPTKLENALARSTNSLACYFEGLSWEGWCL